MSRFSVGKSLNRVGELNAERSSSGTRQSGNTFPQMRKKTSMAMKSVSPVLVTSKSVSTPRVRFVQVGYIFPNLQPWLIGFAQLIAKVRN